MAIDNCDAYTYKYIAFWFWEVLGQYNTYWWYQRTWALGVNEFSIFQFQADLGTNGFALVLPFQLPILNPVSYQTGTEGVIT